MKKTLLASAITLFAASHSYADYQFQLGAAIGQGEISNIDVDTTGIAGQLFISPVDTSKGPLAEAGFLDKASSINFSFQQLDIDVQNADDLDMFSVGGRVVMPSNLILVAELAKTDSDSGSNDEDTVEVGIGTYLNDNTDIVVSYMTADEADVDALNARLHGVNPMGQGTSLAYDIALSYIDDKLADETGHSIGGGVMYYFNNAVGVGVNAELTEVGNMDTDMMSIDLSFFPIPEVEIAASYFDLGGDLEGDGILIGAAVRF